MTNEEKLELTNLLTNPSTAVDGGILPYYVRTMNGDLQIKIAERVKELLEKI